jgi:hypothetical protein
VIYDNRYVGYFMQKYMYFLEPVYPYMTRPLFVPEPQKAILEFLIQFAGMGSNQAATICAAIQVLFTCADPELICNSLPVT